MAVAHRFFCACRGDAGCWIICGKVITRSTASPFNPRTLPHCASGIRRYLLFVLLACLPAAGRAQFTMTPEAIFQSVAPSCATIRGGDSVGSGIVIRSDGLILTNYHVVSAGRKLTVTVPVLENGRWVPKTFDNATVSGVHPKYDLALIKIIYPRVTFSAAKILPNDEKVKTGEVCYAIGNPGGGGLTLNQTITEGIVSAESRQLMGREYIQISAAINPGNSGGPVVDAKGRCIGVATLKLSQTDNIGFAIPVRNININLFVAPAQATADTTPGGGNAKAAFDEIPNRMLIREAELKAQVDFARDKAKAGVEIPAEGLQKPLPAKPDDVLLGYGGTCLVMRFPGLLKVGIFDLCQAQFTNFLDIKEPGVILATGGSLLLIYSPSENKIEKWNLATWKSEGVIKLAPYEQLSAIGMGLLNPLFAVVVRAGDGSSFSPQKLALLTLADGKFWPANCVQAREDVGLPLPHFYSHLSNGSKVRLEDSGNSAVVTGGGRGFLNLATPSRIETSYFHIGGPVDAAVVPGGSHVVIARCDVYPSDGDTKLLKKLDKDIGISVNRLAVSTVAGFRGFAELIRTPDNKQTWLQLRNLPQMDVVYSARISQEVPRRLDEENFFLASAYVGRAAFIDCENKRATLVPIGDKLDATVASKAEPGATFTRKLSITAGTSVKLESGPPGLIYDTSTQELRWTVPPSQPRGGQLSVILLLTDDKGRASYQIEKIIVP